MLNCFVERELCKIVTFNTKCLIIMGLISHAIILTSLISWSSPGSLEIGSFFGNSLPGIINDDHLTSDKQCQPSISMLFVLIIAAGWLVILGNTDPYNWMVPEIQLKEIWAWATCYPYKHFGRLCRLRCCLCCSSQPNFTIILLSFFFVCVWQHLSSSLLANFDYTIRCYQL